MPTDNDGYTVMITADQRADLKRGTGQDMPTGEEAHWPMEDKPEPAFKFSNDDGTKLYRTADGLGMTTSGTKIELVYRKECECKE